MSGASVQFNRNDFRREFRRYLLTTSKTLAEAINTKAYLIAWRAMRGTNKASRAEILQLGNLKETQRGKSGRLLKRKRLVQTSKSSRARAIVVAGLRKAGRLKDFSSQQINERADKMVKSRLRAVSFLRAGWLPAVRKLFRFTSVKKPLVGEVRSRGRPKGKGTPAQNGFDPVATIENFALDYAQKRGMLGPGQQQARRDLETGLDKAFSAETADMRQYLRKKMIRDARKQGANVR